MDDLEKLLDVPFTFSQWCRAGLSEYLPSGKCNCHRCRTSRGEEVTAETNALAKHEAGIADEKYDDWMRGFLAECRKARNENEAV